MGALISYSEHPLWSLEGTPLLVIRSPPLTNGSSYPSGHSLGPPLGDSGPPFSEPRCILAKVPLLAPCKARLYSHREAPRFWPLRRIPRHCDDEDPLHLSLRTSSLFVITEPFSLRHRKAPFFFLSLLGPWFSLLRSPPLFVMARPSSFRHSKSSSFRYCGALFSSSLRGPSLLPIATNPSSLSLQGTPALLIARPFLFSSLRGTKCRSNLRPLPSSTKGLWASSPHFFPGLYGVPGANTL